MGLSVKLPASCEEALELPFTKPTGYGLGKAGWVSATFGPEEAPPVAILKGWIRESYSSIAPKRLLDQLETGDGRKAAQRGASPPSAPRGGPRARPAEPESGSRPRR
jgi:hypothetical protein